MSIYDTVIARSGNNRFQQYFPVGLRFQGDIQTFVLEKAFFIGNGEWRHVGELDETELELRLFRFVRRRLRAARGHGQQKNHQGHHAA